MKKPDDSLAVSCDCGHAWIEQFTLPMEMSAWLKAVGRMKCPACGGKHKKLSIHFGDGPKHPPHVLQPNQKGTDQ